MSIVRISACLAAFVLLTALAQRAEAQREIHHIPPWITAEGDNPDLTQPFIDPLAFDPDWNFFAPADVEPFGGGPDLKIGWYATYDRMHIWSSRPEFQIATNPTGTTLRELPDSHGGDYGWGNRYDVGYMTGEDHGWSLSWWNLRGPNYYDVTEVERINVLQPDDEINLSLPIIDLRNGDMIDAPDGGDTPGFPIRDRNNAITGARDYILYNSVNVSNMTSVEFNKTFRVEQLAYGSVLEPFFGFRYLRFGDVFNRATYNRFDEDGFPLGDNIPPVNLPPALGPVTNFEIEDFQNFQSIVQNHMVGGQLGVRWYKRKERWILSAEARAYALQNFQDFYAVNTLERTYYDGVSAGAEIETVTYNIGSNSGHGGEFVWGGEVRAEAAYEFSRDFALRVGMTYMELAQGIGRGQNLSMNNQRVTMIGTSMGFTINR